MWAWFGGAGRRDELKIYEMCSKVDSLAYDLFKENLKTKRIIRKWEKFLKANSKDLKEPYSKFEKLKRIKQF
jgi:hypothetical protein